MSMQVRSIPTESAQGVSKFLEFRIPTTTQHMSDAQKKAITDAVQPGDVLLETNDAYPEWQRVEHLALRTEHTHAAIYEGNGKFIQANIGGVQRTDLSQYLEGRIHVSVVRPPYQSTTDRDAALAFAASQIGKPYNTGFDSSSTSSYYCSQLVDEALRHMPHPIEVHRDGVLGRPTVAPDAFKAIPGAKMVIDDHRTFWQNQLTHWPVALGTVASSAAAATAGAMQLGALGGVLGGVLGFAGGLVLSICVGNKIQADHFNFGRGCSEHA